MASYFPLVGHWYKDLESNQQFEIVAIDEKHSTIEVQYFDGDIGEFDMESWVSLNAVETNAPEQAYAGFESMPSFSDEAPSDVTFMQGNPLESIEPDSFTGFDDPY